ncbi:MAG: aconitate hydratase AcnA [Chlorobium sp.]|jgi:aconitate hydratase|nr:aconitate hydratase AcnA [Chlorobium sp.]
MRSQKDPSGVTRSLQTGDGTVLYCSLSALETSGFGAVSRLPKSMKVLLESALRNVDDETVRQSDVMLLAEGACAGVKAVEVPFKPARVLLQDFTGVPALVDLASLREACLLSGGDPERINPVVPCDLVIDHSLQVDAYGTPDALKINLDLEFDRNRERYAFLKWAERAFRNFRVVPPGTGIVHQVNLEYLSRVVCVENGMAFPDSLVGTDSHTTMINGLGVTGWGVGGIEAEAVMLGQPVYLLRPSVTGVRVHGELVAGVTATDLVLTMTERLRRVGVVNDFVEFFGPGLDLLSLPDRATIANMAPEYGATMGFFPVDAVTLDYLHMTGRGSCCDLVERYSKEQGLWRDPASDPLFTRVVDFDLGSVVPSVAGPGRPQDRIALSMVKESWLRGFAELYGRQPKVRFPGARVMDNEDGKLFLPDAKPEGDGAGEGRHGFSLDDGAVVIAAITSCTNTSNPSVMIAAGLLAKAAVSRGLAVKPWVKTSMAPGSRVVSDYLEQSGLAVPLDALGFNIIGYGCTTCIGNSGPLPENVARAIDAKGVVAAAVLSGNRNFEGRIQSQVRANYLMSPPLVVAYAIAGTMAIDLLTEPMGTDHDGIPVYLRDLWPTQGEVNSVRERSVRQKMYADNYNDVFKGTTQWAEIPASEECLYRWDERSTYICRPPFLDRVAEVPPIPAPVLGARCLVLFGDSITTDHISPAGSIGASRPAGLYLQSLGVPPGEFNSFGSRRGNHEVMTRGTFDNIRIRNRLAPGMEAGMTTWFSSDGSRREAMPIFDAAMRYLAENVPLVVIAGRDYGMGSSRDWAAKGTLLLGVRAVVARSFERIHRANLVGMGVLPLEFADAGSPESIGLKGDEFFEIPLGGTITPRERITVTATDPLSLEKKQFSVISRIDTPVEADYFRNGGILPAVLRKILKDEHKTEG